MSKRRRGLERFLHQFDKDAALRERFAADPEQVARDLNLAEEELAAIKADDVVTIFQWGVHPLLIRNYAGFLKMDYYGVLKAKGLAPD